MNRHEQLVDNYEDALFALFMEKAAEYEGARLLEVLEEADGGGSVEVPPELDRRCLRTIRRAGAKRRLKRLAGGASKAFARASIAAMLALILFTSAYAAIPEVRTGTLKLLISISGPETTLTLTEGPEEPVIEPNADVDLGGYKLTYIPDGFEPAGEGVTDKTQFALYKNGGSSFAVQILDANNAQHSLDTENADSVEVISVHGWDGLKINKDDRCIITWADLDNLRFISVICEKLGEGEALSIARSLTAEGAGDIN